MIPRDHPDATAAREAVQRLIDRVEPLIRRRLRSKMAAVRAVYDMDDVIASLRRRMDGAWVAGRFGQSVPDESALAKYAQQVATHVALSAMRRERRQRARLRRAVQLGMIQRPIVLEAGRRPDPRDLERMLAGHLRPMDTEKQTLLRLWARGYSYHEMAAHLGLSPEALRTRLQRVKTTIRVSISRN